MPSVHPLTPSSYASSVPPEHEELAMGALASGGSVVLNDDVVRDLGITSEELRDVVQKERRELDRRESAYRGGKEPIDVAGKTVIVVDDGLATTSVRQRRYRSDAGVVGLACARVDPRAAAQARVRYSCFDQVPSGAGEVCCYGAAFGAGESCETQAVDQLQELQRHALDYIRTDGTAAEDEQFWAERNAWSVRNAEDYHRTMFHGQVESWNLRATHMEDTLDALISHLDRHNEASASAPLRTTRSPAFSVALASRGQSASSTYPEPNATTTTSTPASPTSSTP